MDELIFASNTSLRLNNNNIYILLLYNIIIFVYTSGAMFSENVSLKITN